MFPTAKRSGQVQPVNRPVPPDVSGDLNRLIVHPALLPKGAVAGMYENVHHQTVEPLIRMLQAADELGIGLQVLILENPLDHLPAPVLARSEEHTSELQSRLHLV